MAQRADFLYISLDSSYSFGFAVLIKTQVNGDTLAWPHSQIRKHPPEPDKVSQDNDRVEGHHRKDAKELVWDSCPCGTAANLAFLCHGLYFLSTEFYCP